MSNDDDRDRGDELGVPDTDPETIDPAGHMADLVESGAVDMELADNQDADELREFLNRVDRGEYDADPGLEGTVRIVRSLLDDSDASTSEGGDAPAGERDVDVEFPSGKDRDACVDAVHAARQYLKAEGRATMSEIVAAIYPDHPLGYDVDGSLEQRNTTGKDYRGGWWSRVVRPGLETFDDVENPAIGASEWRYTGDQ